MNKLYLIRAAFFACLLFSNCDKTEDKLLNETHSVVQVDLQVNEQYQYDTRISGDEEGADISTQASHFEISEIIRNESTNFSAVYKYKPELDYTGMDEVEIMLSTGSDGASPSTSFEFIKITFNILE